MTTASHVNWEPIAARSAGAPCLAIAIAIAVCGGFSIGLVPMQIVSSDAATSAASLMANQGLFKLGLVELTFTDVAALDCTYIMLLVILAVSEISFGVCLLIRGGRTSPQFTPATA